MPGVAGKPQEHTGNRGFACRDRGDVAGVANELELLRRGKLPGGQCVAAMAQPVVNRYCLENGVEDE